jgi:rhodanese-related sulfurtransferase
MSDNSFVDLEPSEFSQKLKEDLNGVLIDVRTPGEYNGGHIPNSKLMNIYEPTFADDIQKLDRNKNYYLYCRSGSRSYHASKLMKKLGFNNVYNLSSGIIDWDEPLEK